MKLHLGNTDIKILELMLKDDDMVQNHYSKEIFNCHFLSDYISKLRMKLGKYFKDDGFNIIATEKHEVIKIDKSKTIIGIYRLYPNYKNKIENLLKNYKKKNKNIHQKSQNLSKIKADKNGR